MREDLHLPVALAAAVLLGCGWFGDEVLEVGWLKWVFAGAAALVAVCWSLAIVISLAEMLGRALRQLPAVLRTGGFSLLREAGAADRPVRRPVTRTGKVLTVLASGGVYLLREPQAADPRSPSPS